MKKQKGTSDLIIVSSNKDATLSKSAKKFNTLLKKLEQLKTDQEKQSEERLTYINEMLKEQVREEEYKFAMILNDPRYNLLRYFSSSANIVYYSPKLIAKEQQKHLDNYKFMMSQMHASKKDANSVIKNIVDEMKG